MENGVKYTIVVGGIIERDGKYLLIQEAKENCRGKWWFEMGHLEDGENVFDGAIREIKEECGFDVDLTGVCSIVFQPEHSVLGFYFTTKILTDKLNYNSQEILDARWFTYEEILAMKDQIRVPGAMMTALENVRAGKIMPLDIIKDLKWEK